MKHTGLLARGRAEGEDMIVRGKRKCCSARPDPSFPSFPNLGYLNLTPWL